MQLFFSYDSYTNSNGELWLHFTNPYSREKKKKKDTDGNRTLLNLQTRGYYLKKIKIKKSNVAWNQSIKYAQI